MTADADIDPTEAARPVGDGSTDPGERQEVEPLLEVEGLKKHFDTADGFLDRVLGSGGKVKAVDGVDLELYPGETLAVVGESGCGKSTLGQTILNLHTPTEGTVRFRGEEISGLSDREMRPFRRDLQMIFQDPLASLNPRQTVGQILKAPMEVHDIGEDDAVRTERAEELLERVGLKAGHMDRYPQQFSGGQQQRVGIARALSVDPELIVADEPVSALDVSVQAQVLNLLKELQDEFELTLIFIAHDLSVVRHIADRVAVMYLGQIVETAPVEPLFEDPSHPYTRSLLSAVPRIDPEARTDRIILSGSVPSPIDPPAGCRFHTRCPAVIPPEDWPASQEAFRRAFTFRTRIENDEVDPDAVRDRIVAERGEAGKQAVADRLIEGTLPGELATLPQEAAGPIREAANALAMGDHSDAVRIVTDAFPSPCEQHSPEDIDAGERTVACHRHDPEFDATTDW